MATEPNIPYLDTYIAWIERIRRLNLSLKQVEVLQGCTVKQSWYFWDYFLSSQARIFKEQELSTNCFLLCRTETCKMSLQDE